jgi:hypothetical protein
MHGPFFPGVPSWVLLLAVSALVLIITLVLTGPRAPPPAPPPDYDQLRKRYELMARVTGALFCLGVIWGFALALKVDYRQLHYGIAGGTAALLATCYLAAAMRMSPERSWREYLRYEDLHRAPLGLPAISYIYLMFGFIIWGAVSAARAVFGP